MVCTLISKRDAEAKLRAQGFEYGTSEIQIAFAARFVRADVTDTSIVREDVPVFVDLGETNENSPREEVHSRSPGDFDVVCAANRQ